MVLLLGAAKVPKSALYGSHRDPWGKAGSPALRLRLFPAGFPSVLGLPDYSALAVPAMSCCDDPLYAKSVLTLFVSILDRR